MRSGDTLVVWKLDRLARSLKQLIETVDEVEKRQIGFCSITEAIDTTTAGGKLVFHIFAALAEFERSIIRERTRAGLDAVRARGRKGGRPPALSAQDLKKATAMLHDPEITVEEVAAQLGVGVSTLYRHLPGVRNNSRSYVVYVGPHSNCAGVCTATAARESQETARPLCSAECRLPVPCCR
jgi:DNA invertase Pin-like site-specific DNA recombinase